MSEQEKRELKDKLEKGLKQSYEDLLRRKAALGQDMVFADKNGTPRVVPAKEALKDYEQRSHK
ncbi:MAG: hypothetical protein J1F07_03285 [Muribaculaceae bacterium]|nr:hypothetical protein [Muribaculaceae bacterium]